MRVSGSGRVPRSRHVRARLSARDVPRACAPTTRLAPRSPHLEAGLLGRRPPRRRPARLARLRRPSATRPIPFLDAEMPEDDAAMAELLISQDPPIHTKLRKLINKGFTPAPGRRSSRTASAIASTASSARSPDRNECDLVTDIALWLPLHVIADLVGVPEDDREQVFRWTELTFGFDETVTADERADAATAMFMYADGLCEQRRAEPRDDLLSVLHHRRGRRRDADADADRPVLHALAERGQRDDAQPHHDRACSCCWSTPSSSTRLRADLSLMPTAIEELLRWVSPVMQFTRRATHDTEIGGQHDRGRRPRRARVPVREPRRARVRRPRPARPDPPTERPRRVRRGRSALLSRREPRALRGADHVRGAAHPLRRSRGRGTGRRRSPASTPT